MLLLKTTFRRKYVWFFLKDARNNKFEADGPIRPFGNAVLDG
jgi:hypothetical protein